MDDTPACTINGGNCLDIENTCTDAVDDKVDNKSNIMAYACMLMFTPNQTQTMRDNLINISPEIIMENSPCNQMVSISDQNIKSDSDYKLEIYPNPSNGKFRVDYSQKETTDITVNLYGPTGKLINSETKFNSKDIYKEFDPNPFHSGIYFIVISNDEKTIARKVIVAK